MANWTPTPTYNITYNDNPPSGHSDSGAAPTNGSTYATGATVPIAGKGTMAVNGYTFTGWTCTTTGGASASYTAGQAGSSHFTEASANTACTANWIPTPTYNITYSANPPSGHSATGTTPSDSNTYATGATVPIAAPGSMAVNGYTFTGWTCTTTGGASATYTAAQAGSSNFTEASANTACTANWTAVSGGGSGSSNGSGSGSGAGSGVPTNGSPSSTASSPLAYTGLNTDRLIFAAFVLLGFGAMLLNMRRRRSQV